MFIARENELNELEGRYSSDHFEFSYLAFGDMTRQ